MTGMTGVDWPTIQQAAEDVAGVGLASAAAGLLCVRLLARRSMATLLFVVAAVVIASSAVGVEIVAHQMLVSVADRNVVLVVVVMAALAGFAVALVVGHQVTSASRVLLNAVRAVGSIGYFEPPKARLAAEFETLSDELAAAHEKIAESRTRERALEASRRELVAWVSHDLRTPLAGLRAMAEALEDGVVVDFETVTTYHTQIRREADRLSAMIDDLFELARIHAGALRLSRRLVGLDDLVAEALATTEPLARAKGVRLRGSSVRGLPVLVDADEFGRALRNLVSNAIRHTPSEGLVEVQGDVHRGMACVSVVDACGGIPEEALPRVFDVAFRAETARTPGPDNNAGLGLSIARGIVEAHAGQIAVQNMARGCQFVIRLPLARSDAPAEMAPVAGPANGGRLLTNGQGVN
jgi:signal transduction histidine kinase